MFGLPRREGLPYPEWLNEDFERTYQLRERRRYWVDLTSGGSEIGSRPEARAFLNQPYWTWFFELQDAGGTREALEVRYPFFDIRLLDFMLGIPPIPWCVEKNILRVAMKGRLPEAVRLRPKTPMASDGFSERRTQIRYAQLALTPELERFVDVSKLAKMEFAPATAFGQALGALSLDWWLRQFRALPTLQEGTA
jgi:asparagine synthase (glutamine-hydrolysing)